MKITCQSWKSALIHGQNPRYRWTSYVDNTGIELDGADIYNTCSYANGRFSNDVGDTVCRIVVIATSKSFTFPTNVIKTLTTGDTTIESEFTVTDAPTSVEGVTFNQCIDGILNFRLDVTGGNWPLIKQAGEREIGHINIYFFETPAEAKQYLDLSGNEQDTYAKEHAWNYDEVQAITNPLNTTFYVYRNNTWKPKTTIRWKSTKIGKGKVYEPTDCIINIRVWQTVKNVLGWTPAFPTNNDTAPDPVPSGTQVIFTGRFSEGKYQITYDKLLKIFNKKAFPTAYGFIFEFWVKASDGSETRHCWAYLHNENGVQYNKVPLKNWGAGYYASSGEDTSKAVLGEGDGESDAGYEEFNDSTQTPEAVTPFSAVGALTQSYALTTSRCQSFGDYLWNAGVFSNIKLMNNSPIENVVACKIFPMAFTGTDEKIKLGNVTLDVQGAKMTSNSTFLYDIGTITLSEYYHSFLDYEPFTSVNIFLPFIGFQSLPCTLLMNHSVNVKYAVDVITGSCKAMIYRDGIEVLSFSGVMGIDIPVSAQNRAQVEMAYIETGAKTAIDTVATVATGGASKAMTALSAVGGASEGLLDLAKAQYRTSTTGSHNSATSACETLQCYIIVDRPIWQDLQGFNHAYGRMCNLTQNLSNLSGFTICNSHIDLSGIECTEEEREEIFNYLTGGVIL